MYDHHKHLRTAPCSWLQGNMCCAVRHDNGTIPGMNFFGLIKYSNN